MSKCNGNGEWEESEKEFYVADSETSEFENDGTAEYVGNGYDWIRGEESVDDGKWHHVAVTWDSDEEEGLPPYTVSHVRYCEEDRPNSQS